MEDVAGAVARPDGARPSLGATDQIAIASWSVLFRSEGTSSPGKALAAEDPISLWLPLAPEGFSKPPVEQGVNVWAPDTRYWVRRSDSHLYPHNTAVHLFDATGSAAMIGWETAITCAHCLYVAGSGWAVRSYWALGVAQTNSPYSLTMQFPTNGGYASKNCYTAVVPSAWTQLLANGTPNFNEDFGIMDFHPCGNYPGYPYRWAPVGIGSTSDFTSGSTWLSGYDGSSPTNPPGDGLIYIMRSNITRTAGPGGIWLQSNNNLHINTYMDIFHGASGSGFINQVFASVGDPTYYWVGNYWGSEVTTVNKGRRVTASTWGFIQDNSYEF